MNVLRIPLIILALVGLIAVAGCGGDDDSSSETSDSGEALSSEEYSTQASEILTTFGTEFQSLGTEISASQNEEDFTAAVDEAEATIQSTIEEYSALVPPEEAQEGHDQVVAALESFSTSLTGVSDAAASGDQAALQEAALQLQEEATTFSTDLTEAGQSLEDAGITFPGSAAPTGG
jgi:multidrug resistance efflux pump